MSSFRDYLKHQKMTEPERMAQFEKGLTDYPAVMLAIIGEKTDQGGWDSWPHTLMVYEQSGKLKWNFHCKATKSTIFGTFPDNVLSIEDIEKDLQEGRCERRKG